MASQYLDSAALSIWIIMNADSILTIDKVIPKAFKSTTSTSIPLVFPNLDSHHKEIQLINTPNTFCSWICNIFVTF